MSVHFGMFAYLVFIIFENHAGMEDLHQWNHHSYEIIGTLESF